ncbi:MAG: class I SAM-dependent methyltransferase [Thiohalocapsa sp.]
MATEQQVAGHYGSVGIAERVLAALRQAHGEDAAITIDALAPLDQFHSRGPLATQELVALLKPQPGELVLDIGSGIGGPARWIAAKCGVHVTGVDLTPEFCQAAEALNRAARLEDRVRILKGSALSLPVPDGSFDAAYSQNVVMNIADKPRFYCEAWRALRPGGRLALSNVCAGDAGEPYFPVPWATSRETSFLSTPAEMRADLAAAGFEIVHFEDTTEAIAAQQRRNRERIERGQMPPVAADLILGPRAREMQRNTMKSLEEGRTRTVEALVRKETL